MAVLFYYTTLVKGLDCGVSSSLNLECSLIERVLLASGSTVSIVLLSTRSMVGMIVQ